MADIRFSCDSCGQVLEAPPEYAGSVVECPTCQKELTVPGDAAPAAAGVQCPGCGAEMPDGAVLCVACGYHTKLGKKIDTQLS